MTHREHRVTFYSPGTLLSEQTIKPIAEWDLRAAIGLAEHVTERYGAKPFSFRFSTILVADPVPDGEGGTLGVRPKEVAKSATHHLGGTVETYAEIMARDCDDERILRSNMECNGYGAVVVNTNSYKSTHPFTGDDVLVDATGAIVDRASNYTASEMKL